MGRFVHSYHDICIKTSIIFCIILMGIFSTLTIDVSAKDVLRVAYPIQEGLTMIDKNGEYSGYTYDYLMEISQFTGWNYEFITLTGDTNQVLLQMFDMLQKGEIDIMGAIRQNESTIDMYDITSVHYGTTSLALYALQSNTHITNKNYYEMSNLKIATILNSVKNTELLVKFCQMNGITYQIIKYETTDKMVKALEDGEVDVMLEKDISGVENVKTIAKFSPEPFFFATTKGNKQIVNQLNSALLNIENTNPLFGSNTYDSYFGDSNNRLFHISEGEKAYVLNAKTLKVGILPDSKPLQYFDDESRQFKGVIVETLNYISRISGIKFEYIKIPSQDAVKDMFLQGKIDIIPVMDYNYNIAKQYNAFLCTPMFSSSLVRIESTISRKSNEDTALPKNLIYLSTYGKLVGNIKLYDTTKEAMKAVDNGDVMCAYIDGYVAQNIINHSIYKTLNIVPVPNITNNVCVAVSKSHPTELVSVLNKAIQSISKQEMESIIYSNTLQKTSFDIHNLLITYPIETALVCVTLFMLVILYLSFFLTRTIKMKRQIYQHNKRFMELCDISGETICEYNYQSDILTISNSNKNDLFSKSIYIDFMLTHISSNTIENIIYSLITEENYYRNDDFLCVNSQNAKRWVNINHRIVNNVEGQPAYFICKVEDVHKMVQEKAELTSKAQIDNLTQVYNSGTFRSMVVDYLDSKTGTPNGTIIIFDIDYFKNVNDQKGHLFGDMVLSSIGKVLPTIFRQNDIFGRIGGDEFMIFLPNFTDKELVSQRCSLLLEKIHSFPFDIKITLSIGASIFYGETNFDNLYKYADNALYHVKNNGRNGFHILAYENFKEKVNNN